ncbi:MAG: sulfatase [Planctomycetia bacterium]|nr:sulfatase [Planctomycetia bacterium]
MQALCLVLLLAAKTPNVVLIVADDHGWPDFGFMGSKEVRTPHLDRLAESSAVFPNGYVPTSLCRASLATILTGQHAYQHKICCNDPPDGVDRSLMHPFIKKAPALPRLLGTAGYISLQTGKFWEGHFSNAGFTQGMTTKGRHGDDGLIIGRKTMKPIYDFIAGAGNKPWMVWYAPMLPHEPHNPPERLLKKYISQDRHLKQAKYLAMIEWLDETVGELLKYLDDKRLRDSTLVLFIVDNGWIQETGEKRTTRGWFAPRSKLSPYDGGVRTPLMIRWPGHIKPGRYNDLVSTIDIAPTTLTACGLKVPAEMSGISLLEAANGKTLVRKAVFGEIYEHTAIDIEKPGVNLTHRWVREGAWKLIVPVKGKVELFNVGSDPYEKTDLSAREPDQVKQLKARIERWWNGRSD